MTIDPVAGAAPPSSASDDLMALSSSPYVLFTTFRRTGVGVPTPVWIARQENTLVFTTSVESGKVRRLRANPEVLLQSCDRVGRAADSAAVVKGHAVVVDDRAGLQGGIDAILAKYGAAARRLIGSADDRIPSTRVVIRITRRD